MLEEIYYGNSVREYLVAAAMAVGVFILTLLLRTLVRRRIEALAEKTPTRFDDIIVAALVQTRSLALLAIGLYCGSLYLAIPDRARRVIGIIASCIVLIQIGVWISAGLKEAVREIDSDRRKQGDVAGLGAVQMLSLLGRIAAWAIILLLILANVGVDITALVAGLGIGGIAVALALQNILSDLFASVSIVLDKPFEVGDFIMLGENMGWVEHVGLKTTRIRSLGGEELVVSNNDLLSSRIHNYKRMQERRAMFTMGVTYQTPTETLRQIPDWIEQVIDPIEEARFDRAHFRGFGDSALVFEIVYWVLSSEYGAYMDLQQKVNLGIMEKLEEAGVQFAYPTQTLYVNSIAN